MVHIKSVVYIQYQSGIMVHIKSVDTYNINQVSLSYEKFSIHTISIRYHGSYKKCSIHTI